MYMIWQWSQNATQQPTYISNRMQTGMLIQWMEEILHHLDQHLEDLPASSPLTPALNIGSLFS